MNAFSKMLEVSPPATTGYWIARHSTLRDIYMQRARSSRIDPGLRTFFVREARDRNHDLVRVLKTMGPAHQPAGNSDG